MISFTLRRLLDSGEGDGVIGVLMGFYTLEEEADDPLGYPRIPAGRYICKRSRFHRGGYDTFEITGVPGRSRILFHKGNTEEDTMGCVLLGMELGTLVVRDEETGERRRKVAVLRSGDAFREFMDALRGVDEWEVVVLDPDDAWEAPEPRMVDSGIYDARRKQD